MKWIKKWAVMRCGKCGQTGGYYYLGSEELYEPSIRNSSYAKLYAAGFEETDFICEKCHHGILEVPVNEWTAEDWAELIGNEFEDQNRHKLVRIPKTMLKSMKQAGVPEEQCVKTMYFFAVNNKLY